ncbi:MAG: DUF4198 domain-containing protein [Pseudomonadota bacterium]
MALAAGLAVLWALSTDVAAAHDFWIQPDRFEASPGGSVKMALLVGHGRYREVSLIPASRVTSFELRDAAGVHDRRSDLRLGVANAQTVVQLNRPGLNMLSLSTDGTYSELPSLRFNDYIKVEGLTPAIEYRARTGQNDALGREIYSRRAKALIEVGAGSPKDEALVTRPIGLTLEIVPEKNPYAAGFDGVLPVRILYQGRPLAGALVKLNNLDFDERPVETHATDAQGRAVFRLPKVGLWQLNVIWTRLIAKDPKADFETTFSSLSLGFPRPGVGGRP